MAATRIEITRNFYATMAAKRSTTPKKRFQRFQLKLTTEHIDGPQFDQGTADPRPL